MRRFYLLILILAIAATKVQAQNVDMALWHYIGVNGATPVLMKTDDTIFINAGPLGHKMLYKFEWAFINQGPDTLRPTDTLVLMTHLDSGMTKMLYDKTGKGMYIGDTLKYQPEAIILEKTLGVTESGVTNVNWCDTMWAKSRADSIIYDPNSFNNKACTRIKLVVWTAGIAGFEAERNVIVLYPNPANHKLTLKYNFENLTTAASVIITDVAGKTVYTQDLGTNLTGTMDYPLQISNLGSGLYFVKLTTAEGKITTSKFVIQ